VVEDCGTAESPLGEESLVAEAAQAAVGRSAAAGIDWSNVRRFMDGIVADVCGMAIVGRVFSELLLVSRRKK